MAIVIEFLKPLVEFIMSFIAQLGYTGIFFLMILESALIPIPSEIIMPFSGFLSSTGRLDPLLVTLSGSLGNLVGSVLTYYLGIKAGRKFILKYGRYIFFKKEHLESTENLFERYGDRISFAGRLLPGIRTYVSLPAGIGKTNFTKFVAYTFAGSLIWNSMLTYVGMSLGSNWKNIDKYSAYLDVAALLAVAVFVIWFVYKTKRKSKAITKERKKN
ncbi:MAG: DedA family protein [Nitrososphaeraceae archaeon]|jgi:membrane protein DedA with SNARE-associated domain